MTLCVKIHSDAIVRGKGGVAAEEKLFGVPKFHSRVKCAMPLTNIISDWIPNASSGLYVKP